MYWSNNTGIVATGKFKDLRRLEATRYIKFYEKLRITDEDLNMKI